MNTAIDLFCGAGGATAGLAAAGFRVLAGIDNWDDALRSYAANHHRAVAVLADLAELDPKKFMSLNGLRKGELGMLKTCPPCQPFSTLGDSKGRRRGLALVSAVADWVSSLRPRLMILENVPGLARTTTYKRLAADLVKLEYSVSDRVVDAADFGVAQRRRRLVLVAVRDRTAAIPDSFWAPSTAKHLDASALLRVAEGSSGNQDPLNRHRRLNQLTLDRVRAIPPGGSRFDLPTNLQLKCHKRIEGKSAAASYGRIRLRGPAGTLTTRCTTPSCGRFLHPTLNRGLTLREAALLQGFPMEYQFVGSYGSIERQIGNAVPPSLVRELSSRAMDLIARGNSGDR